MKYFLISGLVAISLSVFQPLVKKQKTSTFSYELTEIKSQTTKWLPYTSKKGKYKIEFPGKPVLSESPLYGREYGKIILYGASYEPDLNHTFTASYCDYPKSFLRKRDPIELMENARLAALDNSDIRNDTIIDFNGYSALRCVAYYPKTKTHLIYQILLVKNRLYQTIAGSSIEEEEDAYDYLYFINSFSLIK